MKKEERKRKWEDQRWIWLKREKDSTVQYMRETGDQLIKRKEWNEKKGQKIIKEQA